MENFKLPESFFTGNDPHEIAKNLLGFILVRKHESGQIQLGKIIEVEVYHGLSDLASHASKSRTKRNEVMFGAGGYYYIYLIYGMYWNLNIVTGQKETPSAILIRSLEPIFDSDQEFSALSFREKFKLSSGPGKLCRWMSIDKKFYGQSVENDELFIISPKDISLIVNEKLYSTQDNTEMIITAAKRIGVEYAGESRDLYWRYYLSGNDFVSKI